MIDRYAEYLELTGLEKYEDPNPLLETTPYLPSILSLGRKAVPR